MISELISKIIKSVPIVRLEQILAVFWCRCVVCVLSQGGGLHGYAAPYLQRPQEVIQEDDTGREQNTMDIDEKLFIYRVTPNYDEQGQDSACFK